MRKLDNDKRVLVISAVFGRSDAAYSYRVYDHGEVAAEGRKTSRTPRVSDVEDLLATVRVEGYRLRDFDAIGLALPGVVDGNVLHNMGAGYAGHDFTDLVEAAAREGVLLQADNNANAAAVGCYVSQGEHENLALYRQPTGYVVGGHGLVVEGRLVRGSHGLAGELGYLIHRTCDRDELAQRAWTTEGMLDLVSNYILASICIASPEVVYVAVDLLPDMDELRAELAKWLPEGTAPKLVHVSDYHERVLVGEYALCLNALRRAEAEE